MMIASLRATATQAFLDELRSAILNPQTLSELDRLTRLISTLAAS
jgi:hypothetical protein